jgi:hypothetical protein
MTLVGTSFLEKVPAGRDRTIDKVTRILSHYTEAGQRYYRVKIMTPGYGCVIPVRAEVIERKYLPNAKDNNTQ